MTKPIDELLEELGAHGLSDDLNGANCLFCGNDPYHYVDVGVGIDVPVAVVCCEEGIALYQHKDEALSKVAQKLWQSGWVIKTLISIVEGRETPEGLLAIWNEQRSPADEAIATSSLGVK